jgi:hypothetical protein
MEIIGIFFDRCVSIMKKIFVIAILAFILQIFIVEGYSQSYDSSTASVSGSSADVKNLRKVENKAFVPGEKLRYRVHYGFVDAGEAILEVKPEIKKHSGRDVYHIVGTGRSLGAFDWFYKVRDRYETFIDTQAMVPWYFIRKVDEGGYKIDETMAFNPMEGTVSTQSTRNKKPTVKGSYEVPQGIQDMVSAFYFSRTVDLSNVSVGDIIPINAFIDNEVVPLNIRYEGKDVVKTRKGTFNCLKFKPMVQAGRVFKAKDEMTIWISDDQNRIPVRVESAVIVGSIKMDLVEYQNLANPVNFVKKK